MTQITVSTQPVSATVSGNTVVARVPAASPSTAAVTGGPGPAGIAGPQGAPGDALSQASDVQLVGVADGDVVRYSSGKWRNYPEVNLVDGGNFVFALFAFFAS